MVPIIFTITSTTFAEKPPTSNEIPNQTRFFVVLILPKFIAAIIPTPTISIEIKINIAVTYSIN